MQSAVLADRDTRVPTMRESPRTVAVAVLGADALLAAQPATPVQLAHACQQAGFDTAIPVCWGDELVAAETLHQLKDRGARPAIFCSCPLVTSRLLARGPHLVPFMVATVPPPVAAARYVRRLFEGSDVRITYVGACPGATDPAIDERAEPKAFLAALTARGIDPHQQPLVFDSVIPPDRRRHFSVAGGLPAAECLAALEPPRAGVEIAVEDFSSELAQHLIAGECTLLDVAPRLGCVCSGWRDGAAATTGARSALASLDPPRSTHRSVVDLSLGVDVSAPPPAPPVVPAPSRASAAPPARAEERPVEPQSRPQPRPQPAAAAQPVAVAPVPQAPSPPKPGAAAGADTPSRHPPGAATAPGTPAPSAPTPAHPPRRKPAVSGYFRAASAAVPRTRSAEGPSLPRAYVARRRSPAAGMRAVGSRAEESRSSSSLGTGSGSRSRSGSGRGVARGSVALPAPPSAIDTPPEVPVLAPSPPPPTAAAVAEAPPASQPATAARHTEPGRRMHTPHSVGTYTVPPAPDAPPLWRTPAAAIIAALVLLTLIAIAVAVQF